MAIVAIFDLNAEQWDVTNAFVQGQLDEVVYTELLDGFKEAGLCLLLLWPLYGLRRSPRLWQKDLSEKLKDLGLVCIEGMCIFTNDYITVLFFVDDIIPIYHPKNQQKFDEFKEAFKAKLVNTRSKTWENWNGFWASESSETVRIASSSYVKIHMLKK